MSARERDALVGGTGGGKLELDRREAIKLLGGIVIYFTIGEPPALAQRLGWDVYPEDFNAYLRIGEDGRVSCFTGKIEMGQGIVTSLAQMLAEELDVPVATVDMVMGDTALCPVDGATVGSRSTKYFGPALRLAGARARAVLLELASERLNVPSERLIARQGEIFDRSDPGRKVTYAELAKGKHIARGAPADAPLKDRARYSICGQELKRSDGSVKVTGEAEFTGDIRLPGMLYARILRPPAHDSRLVRVDLEAARKVEGVKVIKDGDLIAVLHEHPDLAASALDEIKAEFETPSPVVSNDNLFEYLLRAAPEAETIAKRGDLATGRKLAAQSFEATYLNHYVAHAPIETHTAVVDLEDGRATVWASTQSPFGARSAVARELKLPEDKVRVITPFVGGGFGGKTWNLQVLEAARLARLVEKPVMVAWTREEEFFHDSFRPAAVIKVDSGLTEAGAIAFWDYDNYFAGSRSSEPIYEIPHLRVKSRGGWRGGDSPHPFNVGAWRGPGSNTNVFAMESQIDIMAAAVGVDPLIFRLGRLNNKRMERVLKAAANAFGKPFGRAPSGHGYGIVCTDYLNTHVAAAAEVKVDTATGKIKVERIVCAQDTGEVINPELARQQIEGGLIMGLGYVLSEEIRFIGGRILDRNFDTYEITRFSRVPKIETVLVGGDDMPPQGCGEPSITTMGGVIANAVFDATGVRIYELPMTPARVLRAIEAEKQLTSPRSKV